jgi:hypothetical protein
MGEDRKWPAHGRNVAFDPKRALAAPVGIEPEAAVLRDPASPAESAMFTAIQSVAPSVGVELSPFGMRDAGEIERAITAFASGPNGGLIVLGVPWRTFIAN